MDRLTIVIPALSMSGSLKNLVSQISGTDTPIILSIPDNAPDIFLDQFTKITVTRSRKGRGVQLATGAKAVMTGWVLFLHSDSVLPANWLDCIKTHMQEYPDKAAYFGLSFDTESKQARRVAGWANLRCRLFALPYGDQGLLVRKDLYDAVGGYPDWALMEDVKLVKTLGRKRLHMLPAKITTSADRYEKSGWLKRSLQNFGCLMAYFIGISPDRIAGFYRK